MTILELTRNQSITTLSPYQPFIYRVTVGRISPPGFWTNILGGPDYGDDRRIIISSVKNLYSGSYTEKTTLSDCISTAKSWYFDFTDQVLYVHFDHDESNYLETDIYIIGKVFGFTDSTVLYLDDIEYLPYLDSIPSIAQQADLSGNNKLSFIVGPIKFNNSDGYFDIFKNESIYGNIINIFDLDNDLDSPSRSDLSQIASLYIENYNWTLSRFIIESQDRRKSENTPIPSTLFTTDNYINIEDDYVGEPIPLLYGSVRCSTAIPTNGDSTGAVNFRQALTLTTLGTVQVKSDDKWVTKTPTSSNVSTGEFTLSQADARADGAADGDVLPCRVCGSVGIAITYAPDVIKDLNDREADIVYGATEYDTTEWESEQSDLSPIGIVFNKQIPLFEAIGMIQAGTNKNFRYEFNADGLRTIRVDDWDRASNRHIYNTDIYNINEIAITSDPGLLAASVKVLYHKDFDTDEWLKSVDASKLLYVKQTYNQTPQIEIETYLTTESAADERALWSANRFSDVLRICEIELRGREHLDIRIYDIVTVELTPGFVDLDNDTITGREYFGVWRCQVISINPDARGLKNNIGLILIEEV